MKTKDIVSMGSLAGGQGARSEVARGGGGGRLRETVYERLKRETVYSLKHKPPTSSNSAHPLISLFGLVTNEMKCSMREI